MIGRYLSIQSSLSRPAEPSGQAKLVCDSLEAFKRFVLQKDNPSNKKKVVEGLVRFNHAILKQGLRIVDLPGVEGVSDAVSVATRKFIREKTRTR